MFDSVEIGRRISRLRKERDMTQPALADIMGVSFQAVSNWERGASMPDISKLPELAQVLGVTVDELLGGGRGGELIRSVLDGSEETFVRQERVTLSEAGEAAPLLKPRQVTRIVKTIEEESERRETKSEDADKAARTAHDGFSVDSLISIAPFLDEEYLDELALRLAPDVGLSKLTALAPFISEQMLDRIAGEAFSRSSHLAELVSLAPFLSEEALDRLALRAMQEKTTLGELASLAPFLSEETLDKIAISAARNSAGMGELASLAPFLSEEAIGKIALERVQSGGGVAQLAALVPFLEEDALDTIVQAALKNNQSLGELSALFPFLPKDTLKMLIETALKKNDVAALSKLSVFL